jgi:hypothetical protein
MILTLFTPLLIIIDYAIIDAIDAIIDAIIDYYY